MYFEHVSRDDIKTEIDSLIKDALGDFSQTGNNVYPYVDRVMQMIDSYMLNNNDTKPTRELTVSENAIFNLYRNYLMYQAGTKWKVAFDHTNYEHPLTCDINTSSFYGSHKKLSLSIETYRYEPNQVWLCNFGQLEHQARYYHLPKQKFITIVETFGLEYYNGQVQFIGHANELESNFFKMLEFSHYIQEGNIELPTKAYLSSQHITHVFERTSSGDIKQNIH